MTERERLIKLLNKKQDVGVVYNKSQMDSRYSENKEISNDELADYLIEHGIIVQDCKTCEYLHRMRLLGENLVLVDRPFRYCPECGEKIE